MKSRPGQKIKLTSVEELLGVVNEESAMDLEIAKIRPFKNHPFKVVDDERMQDLMESIRINGILSPTLVRPLGHDTYEMVSGHRRMHAAMLLGMDRIPVIIREMTDDEAVVKMVDANIQREELLPSEKAFAYKMKMEAMKRQGSRTDLTSGQNGPKLAVDAISDEVGDSSRQVKRYIRLTELIPELLDYVDQKRIQFTVAVEISYIDQEIQKWLFEYIKDNGVVKLNQITLLRTQLQTGAITQAKMIALLNGSQPGKAPSSKLTFSEKKLREYFPATYTAYVKSFMTGLSASGAEEERSGKAEGHDRDAGFRTSGEDKAVSRSADPGTSRGDDLGTLEVLNPAFLKVPISAPLKNKTDMNNTDWNNIESDQILSAGSDKMRSDERQAAKKERNDGPVSEAEAYEQLIRENISYDDLLTAHPLDRELIEGIAALILETVLTKSDTILIASNRYPADIVKSKLLKLTYSHIEYVMFCLQRNTTKVNNIKKYLLAALFNAPSTIDGYYRAEVNHDMYGTIAL